MSNGTALGGRYRSRRTVYAGISMRSRLEADFAAYLDSKGRTWRYEPKCFAGPDGQWLPDFELIRPETLGSYENHYIEVKPAAFARLEFANIEAVLRKMEIALLSEPNAYLSLVFWEYGKGVLEVAESLKLDPPDSDKREWWFMHWT